MSWERGERGTGRAWQTFPFLQRTTEERGCCMEASGGSGWCAVHVLGLLLAVQGEREKM